MEMTSLHLDFIATLIGHVGCSRFARQPGPFLTNNPTAGEVISHLNENASRVQSLLAKDLDITLREKGRPPIPLDGKLAFDKPRKFRLTVNAALARVADLGSNDQEFWAYIAAGKRPALIHASYDDYDRASASMPIHPEWIVDSFGVTPLPEDPSLVLLPGRERGTIELETEVTTLQGQPASKVVVVELSSGAIIEQHLSVGGQRVATAHLSAHFRDPVFGAVLPGVLSVQWLEAGTTIKVRMKARDVVVNPEIDPAWAADLWTMPRTVLEMGAEEIDLGDTAYPPRRGGHPQNGF